MQIIILYILLFILSILCYHLYLFYQRRKFINNILEVWQKTIKNGEIRFDGIGNYKYDYYLCFTKINNYSTHIHLITDTPHLFYIAKKNNKHSKLYTFDTSKKPETVVNEMLEIFYKL